MTQKESDQASGSESSSKADTESQADSETGEGSGSEGEGSGSKGAGSGSEGAGSVGEGAGSGSEGVPEDGDSQQGDSSSKIVEVSYHEAEVSGSESSSSFSGSEVEVKKAHPSKETVKADPNTTLPKLDSKDFEEECKINHCGFACHTDAEFGPWWNKKISQDLKQWDKRDKMTSDHAEPGKDVRCPEPLGMPLVYMESCGVFKSLKTSEYDLCHIYKVGLSGEFAEFHTPCKPTTNNHMHSFLEKASECSRQNLLVAHSQDAVTVVCLL